MSQINKVFCSISIIIFLLLASVISHIPVGALSVTDSTTISIPIELTQNVGEYKFPRPFDNWKIYVKIQINSYPTFQARYSSDRNIISPGERVKLQLDVVPTTADVSGRLIIQLLEGTKERNTWQLELPKITIKMPGNYKTPSIPVTTLPLHSFGIPLTVGLTVRAEVITELPIVVKAEKLTPTTQVITIKENQLSVSSSFTKVDGLGARLILDEVGLNFEGKLYIGLTIMELPFVKYDFPSLTLSSFSTKSSVGRELIKLKTPITISVSTDKESVTLRDSLSISGKIVPQVGGVKIELRAKKSGGNWFTIANTLTTSDGSFTIRWVPIEVGDYEISAYHTGEEYTVETWSTNTIKIRVHNPNEILSSYIIIMIVLIALSAAAIGIIAVIRKRRY